MEFKTVKEALEVLMAYNNPKQLPKVKSTDDWKAADANDIQEFNYEALANVCDLLGMEDIYLGNKKADKKNSSTFKFDTHVSDEQIKEASRHC